MIHIQEEGDCLTLRVVTYHSVSLHFFPRDLFFLPAFLTPCVCSFLTDFSIFLIVSLVSFALFVSLLKYAVRFSMAASLLRNTFFLSCLRRCSTPGVMRRWILHFFTILFPLFVTTFRPTRYRRTSSSFDRLNTLQILPTRLGPNRLSTRVSVSPGERAAMSGPTMHPRTAFLLRSPLRLAL